MSVSFVKMARLVEGARRRASKGGHTHRAWVSLTSVRRRVLGSRGWTG